MKLRAASATNGGASRRPRAPGRVIGQTRPLYRRLAALVPITPRYHAPWGFRPVSLFRADGTDEEIRVSGAELSWPAEVAITT